MTHRPLLTFCLSLAAGMLLFSECGHITPVLIVFGVAGVAVLLLVKHPAGFIGGVAMLGVAAGGLRAEWFAVIPPSDISCFTKGVLDRGPYVTLYGSVASEPEAAHGRETFYLSCDRVRVSGAVWAVTGQAYASVPQPESDPFEYGDAVDITGFLVKPRGATNLGAFDWAAFLARRGVRATIPASWPGAVHRGAYGGSGLQRIASALRSEVQCKASQALPAMQADVLSGILVGTGSAIPGDLRADFVHTGTAHILASAGLHVGVLLLCILGLARIAGAPRKVGSLLGIGALVLFMFAAGGRPAVVRACIVGIVWLAGRLVEREPDFLTSLGLSAGIILWFQPTALLEPGFQLSFATVGILCAAMPVWKRLMDKRLGIEKLRGTRRVAASWAVDLIGVAIFAELGSLPIVAANYNEISICGILANIAVVPLVFLIVPIGFAAVALPGAMSVGLFKLAGLLVVGVNGLVAFFSSLPLSFVAVPSPSPLAIVLYYAFLLAGVFLLNRCHRIERPTISS